MNTRDADLKAWGSVKSQDDVVIFHAGTANSEQVVTAVR